MRLLGGAGAGALLPLNFGCGTGEGFTIGCSHIPTPEEPLTPAGRFYVNTNYGEPRVPSSWRLRIRGMVDRELGLTAADLAALPQVAREVTLECIGNHPGGDLMSSSVFTGVLLRDVLEEAGLSERARGLAVLGLDGYPAYLPVHVGRTDEALLVLGLAGEPLPLEHGAPVRMLLPGRYGMVCVKWLDSITASRAFHTWGAFGAISTPIDGLTRVRSRLDSVFEGAELELGRAVELSGLAVTPGIGVASVEVDTGTGWRPAELAFNTVVDDRSALLWSLWRASWTPERRGEHVLRVRATDVEGRAQTEEASFPYDSSAVHSVRVRVVG